MLRRPLEPKQFTYDYVRDAPNKYPDAHLHVYGSSEGFKGLTESSDIEASKLAELHIPVGGERFRPSLDDLIEFCIIENLVSSRSGWKDVIEESRGSYFDNQIEAAVRQAPDIAAKVLRRSGWIVKEPDQE